jgi:hypothetical protein
LYRPVTADRERGLAPGAARLGAEYFCAVQLQRPLQARSGHSWSGTNWRRKGVPWPVYTTHLQHDELKLLSLLSQKNFLNRRSHDRQIFQPNLDRRATREGRFTGRSIQGRMKPRQRQRPALCRTVPNTSSQPIFEFTPHARGSMPPRRQLD